MGLLAAPEIGFEFFKQLHRHLESYGFCIYVHGLVFLLHLIKFRDKIGHVLAQGFAGCLLLLPHTAVQGDGHLGA